MFGVLLFLVIFLLPHGARQIAMFGQHWLGSENRKAEAGGRGSVPSPLSKKRTNQWGKECFPDHITCCRVHDGGHCFFCHQRQRLAQKKYDTGATDTEIKIGNIMPYSGPASAYGVIGKTRPPIST